jgi:hypothetical protein
MEEAAACFPLRDQDREGGLSEALGSVCAAALLTSGSAERNKARLLGLVLFSNEGQSRYCT